MSVDVKAHGKLVFDDPQTLAALLEFDAEDEDAAEVAELVAEGVRQEHNTLLFAVDGHLSNQGNLEFQEWLSDLADEASAGSLDTWQESFGDARYVRLLAGGEELEVRAPYPDPAPGQP